MRSFVCLGKNAAAKSGMLLLAAGLLAACGREDIKVYRVAKDQAAPPAAQSAPEGHPDMGAAAPPLSWTLPAGWESLGAGKMSVASFNIPGKSGQQAQVAVTPLRGLAGKEVLIVNMWRQQVGLSELPEAEAVKELTDVDVGGATGKMFDMAGKSATGATTRIVTAMLHQGDTSWFFKLQGDDELVTAQKPNFLAFLKSVKLPASVADEMAGAPSASPPPGDTPAWPAPADWQAESPGAMQVAKFAVPAVGAARADVTISVFPNSTGGTLANINRWRRQLGLPPVDEAGLAPLIKPLDGKNPDAVLADLSNNGRRLLGAIVPAGGQWYFYKLLGDTAAVTAQEAAFTQFVQAVKY